MIRRSTNLTKTILTYVTNENPPAFIDTDIDCPTNDPTAGCSLIVSDPVPIPNSDINPNTPVTSVQWGFANAQYGDQLRRAYVATNGSLCHYGYNWTHAMPSICSSEKVAPGSTIVLSVDSTDGLGSTDTFYANANNSSQTSLQKELQGVSVAGM